MENQPNLYSIEHSEQGHQDRRLETVEGKTGNNNEELKEAREALLGKDELYERFFQAVKDRETMDSSGFAYIENLFIKYCQNLGDSDIESIVRQFNNGLGVYAREKLVTPSNNQRSPENIRQRELKAQGIISVIEFIKARKKLLDTDPPTNYSFYVEETLDSRYKIDLIECIFEEKDGVLHINTMNLIQVKTSETTEREKGKIVDAHRAWVNSSVMDFDSFRHEYADGIPDEITIERLAKNSEEVEMILLDICTNPNGFNPDDFINRLDLGDLNNKQKAWLMREYGSLIKRYIIESRDNGVIPREEAESIIKAIDDMKSKLQIKVKLPKNIARIGSIKSIIAIGARVVEEEVIKSQSVNPNLDKIVGYN